MPGTGYAGRKLGGNDSGSAGTGMPFYSLNRKQLQHVLQSDGQMTKREKLAELGATSAN